MHAQTLQEKFDLYVALNRAAADPVTGWTDSSCDSLLFNALLAVSLHTDAPEIEHAEGEPGQWFRTPSHDCYPDRSGSTISKDMFDGLFLWILHNRNLVEAEKIYEYGSNNLWVMGEGELSRTVLSPMMIGTLAQLIYHLGGEDKAARHVPVIWPDIERGYVRHLQALHIFIRTLLGVGTQTEMDRLQAMLDDEPRNIIHAAFLGRLVDSAYYDRVVEVLMDTTLFPADRLPTSADRCTDYLWQRDSTSDDWEPCAERNETHPGIDFIFLAALVLGVF